MAAASISSGVSSGMGFIRGINTVFVGYKFSVFKHVVPRAGIEPALP
jgi:hypothetical protein